MVGIENRRTAAGHHDGRVTSGTSAVLRLRGALSATSPARRPNWSLSSDRADTASATDRGGQPSGRDAFDGSDPPSGDGGV